jgi:hypothetical protein
MFSSVACPSLLTFFHVISLTARFGGEGDAIEHKMCISIFSITLVETFFIPRRTERDMKKKCLVVFVKISDILVQFE